MGDCFVTECDLNLFSSVVSTCVVDDAMDADMIAGPPIGHIDIVATVGKIGNCNRTSHGFGLSVSVYKFNEHAFYVDTACR